MSSPHYPELSKFLLLCRARSISNMVTNMYIMYVVCTLDPIHNSQPQPPYRMTGRGKIRT